ncbi:hypothetical protein LTS18_000938, partial [Coniosporium uncinatum]
MATLEDAHVIELVIDYPFRDQELITRALTAAGVDEQSEESHDGNRLVAGYGRNAMSRYELDKAYLAGSTW